ncbi:MAG: glycosyltransferase [Candidatus Bathyarchaeia archaeon]
MPEEKLKVSVVILTRNSAATIRKCLESILHQTRKPDEIIIVDGSSVDGTLDIVKHFPVKIFSEPGLGYGHARNIGVQKAEGDIVFFIDADCYAEPDWIEKILPHFKNSDIAAVTGRLNLWNREDACARFLAYVGGRMNPPAHQQLVEIAPTMNLAFRRNVVFEVGWFDESMARCEDTDFTYRLTRRYKLLYEPEAVVWFRGSPNVWTATRKCIRHFIGVGQLFAKHGFKKQFVRLNLPVRGLILVVAITSLLTLPFYVPATLLFILLMEFLYKTVKMYLRYHDRCVIYYVVFFTFWSLASFAIIYGLCRGLRKRHQNTLPTPRN